MGSLERAIELQRESIGIGETFRKQVLQMRKDVMITQPSRKRR